MKAADTKTSLFPANPRSWVAYTWLLVRIGGVCLCLNGFRYVFIVIENLLLMTTARNGEMLLSQGSGLMGGWAIEAAISLIGGVLVGIMSFAIGALSSVIQDDPVYLRRSDSGYVWLKGAGKTYLASLPRLPR